MGLPRLSLERQVELVPSVLAGLESKPSSHLDSLLLMLGARQSPTEPENQ